MRTGTSRLAWISAALCVASSSVNATLTEEQMKACAAAGNCPTRFTASAAPPAGVAVAVSAIAKLPSPHKEAVAAIYKLLSDPSASQTPLDSRRNDVAERLTQFLWDDYLGKRKVPAASGEATDIDASDFVATAVAVENINRKGGVRSADQTVVARWVTGGGASDQERWSKAALLYYALGPCSPKSAGGCRIPGWIDRNELLAQMQQQNLAPRVFDLQSCWTRPVPGEKEPSIERWAQLKLQCDGPEAKATRRPGAVPGGDIGDWIDAFFSAAAAHSFELLTDPQRQQAAKRLAQAPIRLSAPGGIEPVAHVPSAASPGGAGTWVLNSNETLGDCNNGERDCGGKIAYLYNHAGITHPLSIRLIRIHDDKTHTDGDWLEVTDMVPFGSYKRSHLIPMDGSVTGDDWNMPTSDGKFLHYRFDMLPCPDQKDSCLYITDGKGAPGALSMAPALGDDSFDAYGRNSSADNAACKAALTARQIDNEKCVYAIRYHRLEKSRAREAEVLGRKVPIGSSDYLLVPQGTPRYCFQFIRMQGENASPDCKLDEYKNPKCGVACVKNLDGSLAGKGQDGKVYIGTFEGKPYCLRPKGDAGTEWEPYTDGCKVDLDDLLWPPPADPAKPEKPKVPPVPPSPPAPGGPTKNNEDTTCTEEKPSNPSLSDCNKKIAFGDNSAASMFENRWRIIRFDKGSFVLVLKYDKLVQFGGVLAKSSKAPAIEEKDDAVYVQAALLDGVTDARTIGWVDLDKSEYDEQKGSMMVTAYGLDGAEVGKFKLLSSTVRKIPNSGIDAIPSADTKEGQHPTQADHVQGSQEIYQRNVSNGKDKRTIEYTINSESWEADLNARLNAEAANSRIFGPAQNSACRLADGTPAPDDPGGKKGTTSNRECAIRYVGWLLQNDKTNDVIKNPKWVGKVRLFVAFDEQAQDFNHPQPAAVYSHGVTPEIGCVLEWNLKTQQVQWSQQCGGPRK